MRASVHASLWQSCKCLKKGEVVLPCSHQVRIECHQRVAPPACRQMCKQRLERGHRCRGTCHDCLQGRLHISCRKKCTGSSSAPTSARSPASRPARRARQPASTSASTDAATSPAGRPACPASSPAPGAASTTAARGPARKHAAAPLQQALPEGPRVRPPLPPKVPRVPQVRAAQIILWQREQAGRRLCGAAAMPACKVSEGDQEPLTAAKARPAARTGPSLLHLCRQCLPVLSERPGRCAVSEPPAPRTRPPPLRGLLSPWGKRHALNPAAGRPRPGPGKDVLTFLPLPCTPNRLLPPPPGADPCPHHPSPTWLQGRCKPRNSKAL